jgi:hypothetical protein
MNNEPVKYSRLIMQLMMPTPMKALRQARNASPSSERRTPTAINPDLFAEGCGLILPMFVAIVHVWRGVNLNALRGLDGSHWPETTELAVRAATVTADIGLCVRMR